MPLTYAEYSENKSGSLWNIARKLREAAPYTSKLSAYVFMTDPKRVPSPVAIAEELPKGAAIIFRHFGADGRKETALKLREITRKREQQFLIGADPFLAQIVGADGVHFTRDENLRDPKLWRIKEPEWIITMAGLKDNNDYTDLDDLSVLDGLFVSSIFDSHSPSAGEAIGIERLTELCRALPIPVYALGGVAPETAPHLKETGCAGLAAIDGILQEIRMAADITDDINVEDTSNGHRFVYRLEGHQDAELTMKKMDDDLFNANHTGVPKSMGGKGVGKALVKVMSNHARDNHYRVIPGCPFVVAMWKRHPDWAEGVAA